MSTTHPSLAITEALNTIIINNYIRNRFDDDDDDDDEVMMITDYHSDFRIIIILPPTYDQYPVI